MMSPKYIKNHVAFTQKTILKSSNQCPVKQSPEEKANLKADTVAIRSTSTVPYDEREVSPIFDDNFIEHAFRYRTFFHKEYDENGVSSIKLMTS